MARISLADGSFYDVQETGEEIEALFVAGLDAAASPLVHLTCVDRGKVVIVKAQISTYSASPDHPGSRIRFKRGAILWT